jgi:hypothetical protein
MVRLEYLPAPQTCYCTKYHTAARQSMLRYQKSKPTARGSHVLLLHEKLSHSILVAFGDT